MIKVNSFYPLILEAFKENKTFSFPINGSSMRPMLKSLDIVTIKKIDELKKGDIVFFKRLDNSFVLHRIRNIKNDKYYIVGDHQTKIELVNKDQLIGKVISYMKKDKDKIYNLKGVRYKFYKLLVRIKFIRFIFSHIYK